MAEWPTYLLALDAVSDAHTAVVGAKAVNLAELDRNGFLVPPGFVVTTHAYSDFLLAAGLGERLQMELSRKAFSEMRWEELWDAGLRIRNLFLTHPLPVGLEDQLAAEIASRFGDRPLVLRSSSPQEDHAKASFAGLHSSFVNVGGLPMIVDALRQVWASLWSDAALLYREELGLEAGQARMAVICQELVNGDASGVMFTQAPTDPHQAVIEAVYGLNEGLVDGRIAPDRWFLGRECGDILEHQSPERRESLMADGLGGTVRGDSASASGLPPPLQDAQVSQLFRAGQTLEERFGRPQDVEWTFCQGTLFLLQARPITTADSEDDGRQWYLSLKRRLDELELLRTEIEQDLLPAMLAEAAELAGQDLAALDDQALMQALQARRARYDHWHDVYYEKFIPFAHGMRLFAEFHNDHLKPDDPYAFMDLLQGAELQSKARNRQLAELAAMLRTDRSLHEQFALDPAGVTQADFAAAHAAFLADYGDLSAAATGFRAQEPKQSVLTNILLAMADQTVPAPAHGGSHGAEAKFLNSFRSQQERDHAKRLLAVARASYRLRDDDNIILGRIEAAWLTAHDEAIGRGIISPPAQDSKTPAPPLPGTPRTDAQQMLGQPAAKGVVSGRARVIREHRDLADMKPREILVCDAIDPNMTFAIPLASGIVERRGGMLIHGAIIAREYGLPCVTGIPDACEQIHTGDLICVDGFLGIVTVQKRGGA